MTRRGLTLLELLLALVVTGIVGTIAADAVIEQTRAHLARGVAASHRDALASAAELLAMSLRDAAPSTGDLQLTGDTALDVLAPIGGAVACAARDDRVLLAPPDTGGAAPVAFAADAPDAGDALLLLADSAGGAAWIRRIIVAVAPVVPDCPPHMLAGAGRSGVELRVAPALPDSLAARVAGAPVRVARWIRWATYHAADGVWWLGQRSCVAPGACGGVQPVAGPLAAAEQGMRVARESSAVVIRLRAAPHARATAESLHVRIALRGSP
ncbi:MAG TPA: prepilin-type N-terminal cleavage/methylation domain-containing protein [Gemmatimonadaceae bacterium]|nr:prepilin-type N-terminal cleavage/methylation domain-containing protein [Gemmatimonadaceae bacterium]